MKYSSESRICQNCKNDFIIEPDDFGFYEKMQVPPPVFCPLCRQEKRMIFRNFKTLYKRKSDKTGKMIVSMYKPEAKFPVFESSEWWGDGWDPLSYGLELDLSKNFIDQFATLAAKVPHMALMNTKCENCEYSNFAWGSKNCYLIQGCVEDENCDYGHIVWNSKDCTDNLYVYKSELCYECIDCLNCNKLLYSQESESCADSIGLFDCRGCVNCIGCVGLINKSYCIFNQQVDKATYDKFVKENPVSNQKNLEVILSKVEDLRRSLPQRHFFGSHNTQVSGNHIYNSKNVLDSFDIKGGENSKYCYTSKNIVESYDVAFNPNIGYGYQSLASLGSSNVVGTHVVLASNFAYYSEYCSNCTNIFGCYGLRYKQYCILNKQYTREEYERLIPQIIDNMKKSKDWGEFFPTSISPFGYNESVVNEYMPLSKQEALSRGFTWEDNIPRTKDQETISYTDLPKEPEKYSDELTGEILKCRVCNFNYKLTHREISFYKKLLLAIPSECFNCRHDRRMRARNPRVLWDAKCANCQTDIRTSYTPENQKKCKIYCEKCYQQEIY